LSERLLRKRCTHLRVSREFFFSPSDLEQSLAEFIPSTPPNWRRSSQLRRQAINHLIARRDPFKRLHTACSRRLSRPLAARDKRCGERISSMFIALGELLRNNSAPSLRWSVLIPLMGSHLTNAIHLPPHVARYVFNRSKHNAALNAGPLPHTATA